MPEGESYNPTTADYKKAEESMDLKQELLSEMRTNAHTYLTETEIKMLPKVNLRRNEVSPGTDRIEGVVDGHDITVTISYKAHGAETDGSAVTVDGVVIVATPEELYTLASKFHKMYNAQSFEVQDAAAEEVMPARVKERKEIAERDKTKSANEWVRSL